MKVNRFYMHVAVVIAFWLLRPPPAGAQELVHETSWIGNSFGGADNKWVQNYVDEIEVGSDGTVYTASEWDEAGRCSGIYKDGDVNSELLKQYDGKGGHKAWGWGTAGQSVAIDTTYIYLVNTEGELLRFRRDNQKYVDQIVVGKALGMTAFIVFFVRLLARKNAESFWSESQTEKPLKELFADAVVERNNRTQKI